MENQPQSQPSQPNSNPPITPPPATPSPSQPADQQSQSASSSTPPPSGSVPSSSSSQPSPQLPPPPPLLLEAHNKKSSKVIWLVILGIVLLLLGIGVYALQTYYAAPTPAVPSPTSVPTQEPVVSTPMPEVTEVDSLEEGSPAAGQNVTPVQQNTNQVTGTTTLVPTTPLQ